MKPVTLENIFKKVVALQRDVTQIKKTLTAEPELREEFILKMKKIDHEEAIFVKDFNRRYGLK